MKTIAFSSSTKTPSQQRLAAIVGVDPQGFPLGKNKNPLALYRDYLAEHLELPCPVVDEEEYEDDEYEDEFEEEDEEFAATEASPYQLRGDRRQARSNIGN